VKQKLGTSTSARTPAALDRFARYKDTTIRYIFYILRGAISRARRLTFESPVRTCSRTRPSKS